MTAFKIFSVLLIVCLTLAAGWNHQSLGRANSGNTFRCPSEGFHPDSNDCRIFYRCVDWNSNVFFRDYNEPSLTPFQFTCGEGTVFDPQFNICNHPDQTSRSECGGRKKNGQNGESTTNNQYPFSYPSVLPNGESSPTEGGYPEYPTQEMNTYYPDSYPNMNENQISPDGDIMESSPGDCFGEGFFSVPGDCNKFMRCTDDGMGGYRKFVFRCGEGTVWDQQNLICNHPDSVPGCGGNQSDGGNVQQPEQGGYPEDGNPMEYPHGGYPGDNQQGIGPDQFGYPQENYPHQGGYPGQEEANQSNTNGYPDTQGNQGGYPATDIKPPLENQGYPGQQQGNRPDQSGYPSQQGYPGQPNEAVYPTPGSQPLGQNQGYPQQQENIPPINQQNQGNRPNPSGYPSQQFYPGQQNQGGYPTSANRPPSHNQWYPEQQGTRPPTNQQNQGNRPNPSEYPSQQGYPTPGNRPPEANQVYPEQQGTRPPTNQQNQGNRPNQSGYPSQGSSSQQNGPGNQGPDQSGYPQQGAYPQQPGYPQNSGYPQQPEYPSQPGNKPSQSGYPQQGGYPHGPGESYPPQGGYPLEGSPGDNANKLPMGSANMCQSDGFFSIPGDCIKFYRCVDNGKGGYFRSDFTCGPNTVWDQEQTTCNHPWAVQRNDCSNSLPTSGSSPEIQRPTSNQNPSQSITTTPSQQLSSNQNQIPTETTPSGSQLPSNENQTPIQTTQSSQSPFETTSTTRSQQTTTQKQENLATQMATQSTTEGSQDGSITSTNQPDAPSGSRPCQPDRNQPIKCEKAGFYPIPGNCKKFYRCVDWDGNKSERFSVYYFECGEGTIWDPALQTCNHEESVYPPRDCSDGQNNQTTSVPTSTSPTTNEKSTTESIQSTTGSETDTTPQDESTLQSTESMTTVEMTTEREMTSEKTTEPSSSNPTEPSDSNTTEQGNNPTEPSDSNTTEQGNNNPTEPSDGNTTEPVNNPTDPTTDENNNQTSQPDSGDNNPDCPALEEGQVAFVCPTGFRRHPKDCNLFYQCTISKEGDVNVMTFTCKNESVYDERKIQCLPPEETTPCPSKQNGRRRYTRRVEPEMTSVVPITSSESLCPREGHFPYDGDCQMYFKCKKDDKGRLQGYLYQCREKHTFSSESARCERTSSTARKCARSTQNLTPTNLKWMTSKVPIEYFDAR